MSSSDIDVYLPEGWVVRVAVNAESLIDAIAEQAWRCVAVLSDGRESDVVIGLAVLQACSGEQALSPDRVVFLSAASAPGDAGLWGLARTARLEIPDLAIHCIEASKDQLVPALRLSRSADLEEEYRFTASGAVEVPRLQRHQWSGDASTRTGSTVEDGGVFMARPDVTYVVSGGLGALGLVVAEFLVDRGARHLVLLSRSAGVDSVVPEEVSELRRLARVECVACDVSDLRSVRDAQEAVSRAGMPSVAGVVHAAGVLTDGVLANQSGAKLKLAYGAKVRGAKNLRSVFAPSEFLVLFSSAAATFGSAGQGSYAAANATLDALAESWSGRGERVLSIQWGAWSEAGMAVRHDAVARAKASGFGVIDNELGTAVLGRLLGGDARGTVCVSPIDWDTSGLDSRFVSQFTTRPAVPVSLGDNDSGGFSAEEIHALVRKAVAEAIGRSVEDDDPLMANGMDSLSAVLLGQKLGRALGVSLGSVFVLNHPSIEELVEGLVAKYATAQTEPNTTPTTERAPAQEVPAPVPASAPVPAPAPVSVPASATTLAPAPAAATIAEVQVAQHVTATSAANRTRIEAPSKPAADEPIAIVSSACRLPGDVYSPEDFWKMLQAGTDCVDDIPTSRFDIGQVYDPSPDAVGRSYTRRGAFMREVDSFDNEFFGIPINEARVMDPQQRLLLEVAYEAFHYAGYDKKSLRNADFGVFVGQMNHDWSHMMDSQHLTDPFYGAGASASIMSNRISYLLGLTGPSMTIDTACSSSLVAVDLAVEKLRSGVCSAALVGGVNVMLSSRSFIGGCSAKMLSFEGRCATFDVSADGYCRGEGVGAVVLKRLSDAVVDGDRVLAV
ncbi:SDR family NAD(P)-dependent oxidoreductase, partial [Nocardia sp. NPDC058518]|uniref:SDR family NAD(P)-dependent oxidoreductase n=1 Tax=Nocardia sp. NPDC058518 TaxID=3346534 RepID=UPI00365D09F6